MSQTQLNPYDDMDFDYEFDEQQNPLVYVHDKNQAEGHLKALDNWRAQADQIEEHANYQIERVKMWKEEELRKINRHIQYHESGLIAFLQSQGQKTIRLINGTIKRIAGRDRVEVKDFDALLKWNDAENCGLIRTKQEPDKKAILDHIKATGELPEGVELVTGEDSFKVDTK